MFKKQIAKIERRFPNCSVAINTSEWNTQQTKFSVFIFMPNSSTDIIGLSCSIPILATAIAKAVAMAQEWHDNNAELTAHKKEK